MNSRPINPRSEFLEILQASDESQLLVFRRSRNYLSDPHQRARIFDDFPNLLSDDQVSVLAAELINIINPPDSNFMEQAFAKITDYTLQSNLDEWLIKLINIGKDNLLDRNMQIRQDIKEFLLWDRRIGRAETRDIMMAYVSAISQAVFADPDFKIFVASVSPSLLRSALNYINQHYDELVESQLAPTQPNYYMYSQRYGVPVSGLMYTHKPSSNKQDHGRGAHARTQAPDLDEHSKLKADQKNYEDPDSASCSCFPFMTS